MAISSCSLEAILEKQWEQLKLLETATVFIHGKQVIKEELLKMYKQVENMRDGFEIMRKRFHEMKEENDRCIELTLLMKKLDKTIVRMLNDVPSELISRCYDNENSLSTSIFPEEELMHKLLTVTEIDIEEESTSLKDCKKTLFNEPEIYPTIPLIGEEEFKTIPKYIIGRQPMETVNNFIDAINQVLKAKYTFLSQGKARARKQGSLSLYLHYKKEESDICTDKGYMYFFTGKDYEQYTNLKLDRIKLNLLTVLRHCKRLREYRVKSDIRYIVQ